jgi:hypothetical protein
MFLEVSPISMFFFFHLLILLKLSKGNCNDNSHADCTYTTPSMQPGRGNEAFATKEPTEVNDSTSPQDKNRILILRSSRKQTEQVLWSLPVATH